MKGRINSALVITLLALNMSIIMFGIKTVSGQQREAGVRVGDWAKYNFTFNYTSNDPNPPVTPPPSGLEDVDYYKIVVLSIQATNVTFQTTIRFKNGTETSVTLWSDVANPASMGIGFFVAANLTAGDAIFPGQYSPKINATVMRTYAGTEREVNWIGSETNATLYPYSRAVVKMYMYWDKISGILDELVEEARFTKINGGYVTCLFMRVVMKETNIWSPAYITATVAIHPDSLNLRSKGRWITAIIELPEDYDTHQIATNTIRLNGTIMPAKGSMRRNYGETSQLMVKFDIQEVASLILKNHQFNDRVDRVTLTITGKLKDGTQFMGSDTIKVIGPMLRESKMRLFIKPKWECHWERMHPV